MPRCSGQSGWAATVETLCCLFRHACCSEESSLWTAASAAATDCLPRKSLSSSSLWIKEGMLLDVDYFPVTERCLKSNKNFWGCVHISAPLFSLFDSLCEVGWWSRSQHPGSSSILPRLLFHLFQLTSSTLRRQEDTCSNYCLLCDASISCQRKRKLVKSTLCRASIDAAHTAASFVKSSSPNSFVYTWLLLHAKPWFCHCSDEFGWKRFLLLGTENQVR